jgi:hypothetical protein
LKFVWNLQNEPIKWLWKLVSLSFWTNHNWIEFFCDLNFHFATLG